MPPILPNAAMLESSVSNFWAEQSAVGLTGLSDGQAVIGALALLQAFSEQAEAPVNVREAGAADEIARPVLDPPILPYSNEDMMDILRSLNEKIQSGQLKTAAGNLESARINSEQNAAQQLAKIQDWISKSEKAESRGFWSKVLDWGIRIISIVSAIALCVGTCGAAAPVLALAILGAVASTVSIASDVSESLGGPTFSLGDVLKPVINFVDKYAKGTPLDSLVGKTGIVTLLVDPGEFTKNLTDSLVKLGFSEETAQKIATVVTVVAMIAISLVMLVAIKKTPDFSAMKKLVMAVGQSLSSVAQGAKGVNDYQISDIRLESQLALVEKQKLEASMAQFQHQMEFEQDEIEKLMKQMDESVEAVAKVISGAADSMTQLASNLGGARSARA